MIISEIAKSVAEDLSSSMENKPGKFELPDTRDVTDKAAPHPEYFDAQEIRDKLGDIPNGLEVSEVNLIKNKEDGLRREAEVAGELKEQYPESEGYTIESEAFLRDKDGNILKDPETGEARRIDFVVLDKDGNVVDSIEVTSRTADKTEQSAKEQRIRENGGNYIKTSDGKLAQIPDEVQTRIERRD